MDSLRFYDLIRQFDSQGVQGSIPNHHNFQFQDFTASLISEINFSAFLAFNSEYRMVFFRQTKEYLFALA